MNIAAYEKLTIKDTYYKEVNVTDIAFDGEYLTIHDDVEFGDIYITDSMRDSLCKYVGVSSSLNKGLYSTDKDLWYKVLTKLYKYYSKESIILLLSENDDGTFYVKGLCNHFRTPVSSKAFINKVINFYRDVENTEVVDIGYTEGLTTSSVVVVDNSKVYTDVGNNKFCLGAVFRNDELYNCYCRMVIYYEDGTLYYLPSKQYNLTSSRYDKTTESSIESLEILLLRVSEDFLSEYFHNKSDELISLIKSTKDKFISKMEFERVCNVITNASVSSDFSEDNVSDLMAELSKLDDFEKLYGNINSDYLWKCTAIGGSTLYELLRVVRCISANNVFYPEESNIVRELLGEYLTTPRVCQMIAKKK